MAVSPDGRYVAVSGYDDGRVLVFDTAGRSRLPELLTVTSEKTSGVRLLPTLGSAPAFTENRHTAALAFLPDGSLLTGSEVGIVRVVDPRTGREVRRLTGAPPSRATTRSPCHPTSPWWSRPGRRAWRAGT